MRSPPPHGASVDQCADGGIVRFQTVVQDDVRPGNGHPVQGVSPVLAEIVPTVEIVQDV